VGTLFFPYYNENLVWGDTIFSLTTKGEFSVGGIWKDKVKCASKCTTFLNWGQLARFWWKDEPGVLDTNYIWHFPLVYNCNIQLHAAGLQTSSSVYIC